MSTEALAGLDERRAAAGFFDGAWRRILGGRTPEMAAYLRAERSLAASILGGYAGLVEAGCGDGTLLLPVAVAAGVPYLGLDLAGEAVALARLALGGAPGTALQRDIRELPLLPESLLPPAPRLVAYPFNVLGNIPDPRDALAAAGDADLLLLTYRTTRAATAMRAAYYRACGFEGGFHTDPDGVHYRAGLFTSSVYRRTVLTAWLAELGYTVTGHQVADHGLALHAVRPGGTPPSPCA